MKLTQKIYQALARASELHQGQQRKADQTPYISHPFAVAFILAQYTDNENTIIAGLLHDTLEDVAGYTADDITKEFGEKVTQIVRQVTENKKPDDSLEKQRATWEQRKSAYLEALKTMNKDALMVACADKIHNMMSMKQAHEDIGTKAWERFNASIERRLWFYDQAVKILSQRLKNNITKELQEVHDDIKNTLSV